LTDADSPTNAADIDEGWDDVAPPVDVSITMAPKPTPAVADAASPPVMGKASAKDQRLAKAAKAAKKTARRVARQAERRAREQSNNRAAQKAAASREAKRAAQASTSNEPRPRSRVEKTDALSPAALGGEAKKTRGALFTMLPLIVASLMVLAAIAWFLWARRT
jgi:cobalamin biosynthesis Mg chelatase CobN